MRRSYLLAFVALLVGAPAAAQPAPSDRILVNGKVFTADTARPWAEAIAVRGERIAAVGSTAAIRALAGPETEVVDLRGRVVVPGLIDAHTHAGTWPDGVHLALGDPRNPLPDPDWPTLRAAVRKAAADAEPGTWIFASIGPTVLDEPAVDRFALDEVAPENPVWLEGATGHGLVLNTAAMERLGIAPDRPDPIGGWYGRGPDGRLDGHVWEAAAHADATRALEAEADPGSRVAAFRALSEQFVRWGLTGIELMSNRAPAAEVAAAVAEADVPIRWTIYRWPTPRDSVAEAYPAPAVEIPAGARVRIAGAKWVLDGTPIERRALMREPYADRPGWRGRPDYTPAELRRILAGALESHEQLALHAVGDSTIAMVVGTMRDLAPPAAWRALHVRIEHGDALYPDLVPAVRDLGITVVQNPLHFSTPDVTRPRVGPRADEFQPLASLLAAGIPIALGSDAGGEGRNPWLNVMFAATHPANPAEALTVEQAVTAYTRGAAAAAGMEEETGTLRPGMLADLAVLSQDVFSAPVQALPATTSVLTMIGGEIVHRGDGP